MCSSLSASASAGLWIHKVPRLTHVHLSKQLIFEQTGISAFVLPLARHSQVSLNGKRRVSLVHCDRKFEIKCFSLSRYSNFKMHEFFI